MNLEPFGVGVIGAGEISYTYLYNMTRTFDILNVIGIADMKEDRSLERAQQFGISQMSVEELLSDPRIDIVVNLTYPSSHYGLNKRALEAGKHVYCEKTIADTYEHAKELLKLAESSGLYLGATPDTFLGGGWQTCRKLIDDGMIGEPVMVNAHLVRSYQTSGKDPFPRPGGMWVPGSAIPYDMGAYYVHALVNLLGPVKKVSGFSRRYKKYFTHPCNEHYKEEVTVSAPTVLTGTLQFAGGCIGTLCITSEGAITDTAVVIHGTEGSLYCPDPNFFGDEIYLIRKGDTQKYKMPFTHGFVDMDENTPPFTGKREACHNSVRGIGVADMAWAIRNHRKARANGELGVHALEIIEGIDKSCLEGRTIELSSQPEQPKPLPHGYFGEDAESCLDD